jgi:thiol:disulfide interchange protein DsbD
MFRALHIILAGWLASGCAFAAALPEFLPPEDIFKLQTTVDANGVNLQWDIAEGHYAYTKRLAVKSSSADVVLGEMVAPPGKVKNDPYLGEVAVLRGVIPITVPIVSGEGPTRLIATVQGCADAGLCYPPYSVAVDVEVSPTEGARPALAALIQSDDLIDTALITAEVDEPAAQDQADPASKARMRKLANALGLGGNAAPSAESPAVDGAGMSASQSTIEPKSSALSALSNLGQSLGLGSSGEEYLDPSQAFVVRERVRTDGTIEIRWDVAPGYYLYRHQFKFAVDGGDGASLGAATMVPGKAKNDPYFGDVEVYYNEAVALVPALRDAGDGQNLNLRVSYQGCADAGLCYPPITKSLPFVLPASFTPSDGGSALVALSRTSAASAGSLGAAAASIVATAIPAPGATRNAGPVMVSEQDQLTQVLLGGHLGLIIGVFLVGGLLLAFTPCVLPMIPILSGIIVGEGEGISRTRAFALSFVYVQGMAITYTVLGIAVASSGENFQALMQQPVVLVSFAAIFVALSFSMFGFYELQMPTALQERLARISNSQRSGSFAGAGIMGVLSALIVGPCVAPPLIGALSYISITGDQLTGGVALYSLAMGMGVPLLIVGASAGHVLPRSGAWMDTVKAVFGVLLLGVAIWFLERIVPAWINMILWAALLIVTAIYMGALDHLQAGISGWRRLWKGTGLVMMVYGVMLMVGAASGNTNPMQPLATFAADGSSGSHDQVLAFRQIKGLEGLQAALREAGTRGQPVMLDYYADWCTTCKEMERNAFTDPGVHEALRGVMVLQTDVTATDERDERLRKHFGLIGPPTIQFFRPDGTELKNYRIVGPMDADRFRQHVEQAFRS